MSNPRFERPGPWADYEAQWEMAHGEEHHAVEESSETTREPKSWELGIPKEGIIDGTLFTDAGKEHARQLFESGVVEGTAQVLLGPILETGWGEGVFVDDPERWQAYLDTIATIGAQGYEAAIRDLANLDISEDEKG